MIIVCFVRTLRSKSLTGLGHHGDERPVLSAHPWMNARSGAGVLHCLVRSDARTVASGQGCANFHKKTDRQTGTQAHRHTGTQAHRQTDRQTQRQTNMQTQRQRNIRDRGRQIAMGLIELVLWMNQNCLNGSWWWIWRCSWQLISLDDIEQLFEHLEIDDK